MDWKPAFCMPVLFSPEICVKALFSCASVRPNRAAIGVVSPPAAMKLLMVFPTYVWLTLAPLSTNDVMKSKLMMLMIWSRVRPTKNGEFNESGLPLLMMRLASCPPSAMSGAMLLGSKLMFAVRTLNSTMVTVFPGATVMG